MKILSVDDSRILRQIVKNAVEILGYDFLEAENGKKAFEILEKEGADISLILLDWNMPEMDGITFLKKIKSDERFKNIPVTMLTTEGEKTKMIEAVKAGAKNYLTKPFTQENLITKIQESLGMGMF
jgi:two-component system chemotaxis response regulator CheY